MTQIEFFGALMELKKNRWKINLQRQKISQALLETRDENS